jgi:hypothetical protein
MIVKYEITCLIFTQMVQQKNPTDSKYTIFFQYRAWKTWA